MSMTLKLVELQCLIPSQYSAKFVIYLEINRCTCTPSVLHLYSHWMYNKKSQLTKSNFNLIFSIHRSIMQQNKPKKNPQTVRIYLALYYSQHLFWDALWPREQERKFQSQTPKRSVFFQQCSLPSQVETNPLPKGRRESVSSVGCWRASQKLTTEKKQCKIGSF